MKQYLDLVRLAYNGRPSDDRTGTGTLSIFGHQMRFNLRDGFPLVTTKYTHFPAVVAELLWFLRGSTNAHDLNALGSTIWDEWATEAGELGPIYGHQWRHWRGVDGQVVDQIQAVIHSLRSRPESRRHIVSAWNVSDLPDEGVSPQKNVQQGRMALAPCHTLFQFHVETSQKVRRLSCQVYQRSADVFLGVPFNIASYALLTHLVAHHLGYGVGELIWTGGDCHLYQNHVDQAGELLTSRQPLPLPHIHLLHAPDTPMEHVEPGDIKLSEYHRYAAIKAPVAV